MKLVIVESPAKAKTIEKYLGPGYEVKASKGHIVDLPSSGLAVDVDNKYTPTYVVHKADVVKQLKSALKGKDALILAVDPDREGEAIGWHVARELGLIEKKKSKAPVLPVYRIVFTEITKDAVQEALKHPREIDFNLVNAQQARRILDRLVGYKLSPLLWKKIRYGLSAGRVQSVAVRLIVDREREREAFNPDEYWRLRVSLNEDKSKNIQTIIQKKSDEIDQELVQKTFWFELSKINGKKAEIYTESEMNKIISDMQGGKYLVSDIQEKPLKKSPPSPFSTSLLQQAASNKLGLSASKTMQIAQKLYEQGHITYMRTDSLSMANEAVTTIRKYIEKNYGKEYLPEKVRFYASKSKVAQEAHEAIRPTNATKTSKDLKLEPAQAKLYDLIRSRALASQMSDAKLLQSSMAVDNGIYRVTSTGRKVLFPGYLEVYSETITEADLPNFLIGQEVHPRILFSSQHFTEPPARFSEASLIKELEKLGIGRPSTYAPIIHTIQARKYVEKDGKYFIPTDTGKVVTDLLAKYFANIVDAGFTASMEDQLDHVAEGKLDWIEMLDRFYKPFHKEIELNDGKIKRDEFTVLDKSEEKCPECGKPMVVKLGRFGRFLSCSDFPECKGILALSTDGEDSLEDKSKSPEFLSTYVPAPNTEDGRSFVLKKGRYGEFWAHPDYPKVKDARPLELLPEKIVEIYGEVPLTEDKRPFLLKSGRFGKFWAHPDYPEVKEIRKVKKAKSKH